MSRVAKAPIKLPANVELTLCDGEMIVKGPKGELREKYSRLVAISQDKDSDKVITFNPASKDPQGWAQAGTVRANMNNMIVGVTEGFTRVIELHGVGYRAQASGKSINLSLGYSHPVNYALPDGVTAETPAPTQIVLKGIDKQRLGQVASEIRSKRPPEPYKGKGVRYANEVVRRKEAKKK